MEGPFSVDIETGFEKDETDFHADQRPLLCIGVCYELGKVVVFGKNVMTDSRVMENLALLFRDKPLTMHYGKSDVAGMYPIMGATNLRHDTLLKHYSLDERTGGHKLETLGIELLGVPAWKQMVKPYLAKGKEKNFADIPEDVLYPYNAIDCDVTYRLNLMFSKQLEEQGRTKLPNFLVRASNELVYPEMDGIGFDMPYSIKLSEEYQEALKANEVKINELLNNPQVQVEVVDEEGQKQYPLVNLNPRSPKQLLELFGQRGWKIPVEKSKQTTAAPALQRGLELGWYDTDQTALNFLELLFENRKITKDDGTFCRGLQKQAVKLADGSYRIHTTYTLHVATTGRLSSKSPNLQNVKDDKKIRRQFIATDGNLLLQGDYSQVEGRVIAVLSGDQYLCDLFRNTERDIFDELSVGMYGRLLKDKRRLLKTFFYGLSYGRTAHGIANGFGMDIKYASDQLEQFKKLIPGVIEWQEETWQKVQDQGYLETTFGRRRHFPLITNRNKDDVRNEALAFVPQSTASDICLTAFTHLRPALEEAFDEEVRIRLTIHDAIVTEGPRGLEGEMQQMMEGLMTASGNVWARGQDSDIPFQVAFKSGTSWDQLG
jgi:DNA polymerase-1